MLHPTELAPSEAPLLRRSPSAEALYAHDLPTLDFLVEDAVRSGNTQQIRAAQRYPLQLLLVAFSLIVAAEDTEGPEEKYRSLIKDALPFLTRECTENDVRDGCTEGDYTEDETACSDNRVLTLGLRRLVEAFHLYDMEETYMAAPLVLSLYLRVYGLEGHDPTITIDAGVWLLGVISRLNAGDASCGSPGLRVSERLQQRLLQACAAVDGKNADRQAVAEQAYLLSIGCCGQLVHKKDLPQVAAPLLKFAHEAYLKDRAYLTQCLLSEPIDSGRVILAETQSNEHTDVTTPLETLLLFMSNEFATTFATDQGQVEQLLSTTLVPSTHAADPADDSLWWEAFTFVARNLLQYYSNTPKYAEVVLPGKIAQALSCLGSTNDPASQWRHSLAGASMARAMMNYGLCDGIDFAASALSVDLPVAKKVVLVAPILEALATRAFEEDLWTEEATEQPMDDLFLVALSQPQNASVMELLCRLVFSALEVIDDEESRRCLILRPLRALLPLMDVDVRSKIVTHVLHPGIRSILAQLPTEDGIVDCYRADLDELLCLLCIAAKGMSSSDVSSDFSRLESMLPEYYDARAKISQWCN